jgi:mannose-6-phosphate isomerase-like protein (cupin superfamily)
MSIHVHEDNVAKIEDNNHAGAELIGEQNGAVNGYSLGIAIYYLETYTTPGIHDDQEGFYVVEGSGKAKVGDEEFDIHPGSAFIAQKGAPHSIKRNPDSGPVKVVWSHGPV